MGATVTEEDIKNLVVGGFLTPRELLGCWCALGQDVPAPDSGEIGLRRLLSSWIQGAHPLVHLRSPLIP
jgi:hypothetical protein